MSDWTRVPLGEVATIERRGLSPDQIATGTKYLGLENIDRGGVINGYQTIGKATVASTKFTFTAEHLLYGKLRPNLAKIARPTVAGVCSTDILPLMPGPSLDRDFLAHYLSQPSMVDYAAARAAGANLPRLSPTELAKFMIPLPPIEEQRRIAAILDQADALRAKRREALTLLDDLTQSIFLDMFGHDAATFTVGELASAVRTGPFGSQLLHSEFVDEGIAVLGLDNVVSNEFRWGNRRFITPEKYELLKRYTVHPGDVLISIMGTTGRCVVVPNDIPIAINTKHICAITPDKDRLNSLFLRATFLWHPESRAHLRRQTKGSIMDGLNMGIVKAMPVPLPPVNLQSLFAEKAAEIAVEREVLVRAARANDELFASLQSRAFRGEL